MTGIQKAFVFSLSASAAAGATYGGYVGVRRASVATQTVTQRHKYDPAPLPLGRKIKEIAQETWAPTETSGTGGEAAGLDASVPGSLRPGEAIRDYDPATVAELKREGIDLASINEIRTMMRTALTSGDTTEKMRMAIELKRRFNLEASHEMLTKIERVGPGAHAAGLTDRGRGFVKGVVDTVLGVWDRLIGEVDR